MHSRRFLGKSALIGLCLVVAPAALAITIPSADLSADCDGYTATFHGTGFVAAGESMNVTWQIVLRSQDDASRLVVSGQATLTESEPVDGVVDLTVEEVWPTQLCGQHLILMPAEDDGQGSTYQYGSDAHGGREVFSVTSPADRLLDCSCSDVVEVCRSAGFWGTHAGSDRWGGRNITQAVIDAADGLEICGKFIDGTSIAIAGSALEAMCLSPRGDQRLQLARQLTATSLNCVMSGGGPFCEGVSIEETFNRCNDLCAAGNGASLGECVDALDCFNNGGKLLSNGVCQTGTCADDPSEPCSGSCDCGHDAYGRPVSCNPLADSCATRPLVNADLGLSFEPVGPAGSAWSCSAASRNGCTLLACDGPSSGGQCGGHSSGSHGDRHGWHSRHGGGHGRR